MEVTVYDILSRLDGVKKTGQNSWMGKCPHHADAKASLSIALGNDDKTLLKCHAGCRTNDIVEALGLKMENLFPSGTNKPEKPSTKAYSPLIATYTYRDASGSLLYEKLRREDKSFSQRRPDGKGGWIYNRQGVPRVLYRLHEVSNSEYVLICEGEKDADMLASAGFTATTGENGAGPGKWLPEYTQQLAGKKCFLLGDNDDVGRAYQVETANALHGTAKSVKVLDFSTVWADIPEHGDISDFIDTVGEDAALDALTMLMHDTPEWVPSPVPLVESKPRTISTVRHSVTSEDKLSIATVKTALQDCGITIRHNLLLKEAEIKGLPSCYSSGNAPNILPVFVMDYLKSCAVKNVTQQLIDGYLACIADENRFNPIKELLCCTSWDGADRVKQCFDILGVTEAKHQTYIQKWLIQCIALGLNDENCPIAGEGVLVLQGEQGLAKTSFFRALTPCPSWFCEGAVIDVSDKDTLLKALSGWICELGELDSTLKREQSALKAFITSSEDRIRAPYLRNATRTPRRTSFCGTVNPSDYLRDESGSRRFWTIPVTQIDKKTLFNLPKGWASQLWAQVYKLYQQNPSGFRLTDEEMKQLQADNSAFSVPLPFETELLELMDYTLPFERWQWWRSKEIRKFLPANADAVKVGKALKKIVGEHSTHARHPTPPQLTRLKRGNTEYLIPLKHFEQGWQNTVG